MGIRVGMPLGWYPGASGKDDSRLKAGSGALVFRGFLGALTAEKGLLEHEYSGDAADADAHNGGICLPLDHHKGRQDQHV